MIEIKWHGRGGQGAFSAAKILGNAAVLDNRYALAFPTFGPERRGAPIQAFNKTSEFPIRDRSEVTACDYIVFLDESLFYPNCICELKSDGKVIVNTDNNKKYNEYAQIVTVSASLVVMDILGMPITNTAMLGALLAVSNILDIESAKASIDHYFKENIAQKNKCVIEAVYHKYCEVKIK